MGVLLHSSLESRKGIEYFIAPWSLSTSNVQHPLSSHPHRTGLLASMAFKFAQTSTTIVPCLMPSIATKEVIPYFFGGNLGSPIPLPLSLTPSTLSIAPSTFWSGAAVPLSKSCTIVTVVLHFVARSFCVIFGWISFRRLTIACPTSRPMVFGFTISSERSTLVRCCPSTEGFWQAHVSFAEESKSVTAYGIGRSVLLLCAQDVA